EALLAATLAGMREAGYAYGIIGDPGPVAFYKSRLDALEIPGSEPGLYAGMLRGPAESAGSDSQPWSGERVSTGHGQEKMPMTQKQNDTSKPDGAAAYRDGKKPGPASSDIQVREAGPEGQATRPKKWDKQD